VALKVVMLSSVQELQTVKESMLARCSEAEVVVSWNDDFVAAVPDPVSFLETEQSWRL
jgi:hypothetical protein